LAGRKAKNHPLKNFSENLRYSPWLLNRILGNGNLWGNAIQLMFDVVIPHLEKDGAGEII
jgi:hypothetical protein